MGYVQEARENHVKKKVEEVGIGVIGDGWFHPKEVKEFKGQSLKRKKIMLFVVADDAALRSKMKQRALKECYRYTEKYAECAAGRTLSVVWKCRKQANELNECLHQYTNDSVLEQMKKEYTLQQEGKAPSSLRV